MGRCLSLLAAASIGLSAAPALAQSAPPSAAPAATPPPAAPPPAYGPPPGYGTAPGYPPPWAYGAGAYGTPSAPPPPKTERRSTGMMAAGIVLVGLGATGLLVGSAVYSSESSCIITDVPPGGMVPTTCPDDPHHFDGAIILITSGISAALGIPLWIFGAHRIPITGEVIARPAPTLLVGPKSAALRVVF